MLHGFSKLATIALLIVALEHVALHLLCSSLEVASRRHRCRRRPAAVSATAAYSAASASTLLSSSRVGWSTGDGADSRSTCTGCVAAHSRTFLRLFGARHVDTPLSVNIKICVGVALVTMADRYSSSLQSFVLGHDAGFLILFFIRTLSPRWIPLTRRNVRVLSDSPVLDTSCSRSLSILDTMAPLLTSNSDTMAALLRSNSLSSLVSCSI